MSVESAKEFIERMKTDEDFAKNVMDCKDADARMAFVKTEGYEFTAEDMDIVKSELSDDQLDAVAGGGVLTEFQHFINDIWCYLFAR